VFKITPCVLRRPVCPCICPARPLFVNHENEGC
jgi:hypothetical protein